MSNKRWDRLNELDRMLRGPGANERNAVSETFDGMVRTGRALRESRAECDRLKALLRETLPIVASLEPPDEAMEEWMYLRDRIEKELA